MGGKCQQGVHSDYEARQRPKYTRNLFYIITKKKKKGEPSVQETARFRGT
jgi:hypothetical protein